MGDVQLWLDLTEIVDATSDDLVVSGVADYVPAYRAITDAIHRGQALRVIVRHRACAAWLREAAAKYGPVQIQVREITYRRRLSELWGVQLPSWLSDRDLRASQLLDLPPLTARPGQSFEDLILEAFFGPAFTYEHLPLAHLIDLVRAHDDEQWCAACERPVVRDILHRQLRAWQTSAPQPGVRLLVEALRSDPGELRVLLGQYKVLQGYPAHLGARAMGDNFAQLSDLRLDLTNLPLAAAELGSVQDHIKVHLQGLTRGGLSTDIVRQALEQMSGELLSEFHWVEASLRSGQVQVDDDLLDDVRKVFRPIRYRVANRLADLRLLVEPPRPCSPEEDWTTEQWMRWATDEYLPYRFWLEETDAFDDEIASYADIYADWLYAHFPELLTPYPRLVYRAIPNSEGHMQSDSVLLFILLDNLNYKYVEDLRSLMKAKGYWSSTPEAYLSMLPSATEVSKKAMAVGMPYPFKGTAYKAPVEATWDKHFPGRKTRYLGQIGDLQALSELRHDIYVLNYTPIDTILHSDPGSTGISHTQAARQLLGTLASSIHDFALRFGIENRIRVVICSDHGSTLIPGDAPNVIDSNLVSDRVADARHRYVALSDEELARLPQSVLDQCYLFKGSVFQLDSNYLSARGYYRFKKTTETTYVHGGLTPEETIVPYAAFQRVTVSVKPPTVRLLEDTFRYGVKSQIRLELVNLNELSLQAVRLEVLTANVEAASQVQPDVDAQDVAQLVIDNVRFRQGPEELTELQIAVSYECAGQRGRQMLTFPITIRRLMTSGFDFDF